MESFFKKALTIIGIIVSINVIFFFVMLSSSDKILMDEDDRSLTAVAVREKQQADYVADMRGRLQENIDGMRSTLPRMANADETIRLDNVVLGEGLTIRSSYTFLNQTSQDIQALGGREEVLENIISNQHTIKCNNPDIRQTLELGKLRYVDTYHSNDGSQIGEVVTAEQDCVDAGL
ncbi:hypothetical protein ELY33_04975 [Vreelandella andesensis]|uniref:Uncharacterized protein n=1 Tax=Vreelandella andesensis TaxID=447567 RepID=A0A3S0YKV5_9GAMM|nr:hypothetical protein [Halomonas andesensis]RUR32735.1 hypothetical protein ELY33_04975 [Halomonas andesensis]